VARAIINREQDKARKFIPLDFCEGLVAAISVEVPDARFLSLSHHRLANCELVAVVSEATKRHLKAFLQHHPDDARAFVAHAKSARDLRLTVFAVDDASNSDRIREAHLLST
jgi:DNA gyrase/topoisomerase IV subunit B